ncbi:MAG: DNA primase [Bacteroidetes bacterium]|uniref:DNA primase n=1 Tax=Candidatus Cryptobacteroides excrementavium TaxID=2840759 RepID=A0A9D9J377_9BACT|nr:DNA primase [Candidatus Cryptobacteroides excrementavium]
MIPRETVDRIIDAARIEDVVGDFVPLKRRGANFVACCPFHNEKTPSFYVSPAKGIFKCFGCGKVGTAVGFVMEHENLSYADALRFLAKKYNIEVHEKEESAEDIALRQRNESLMLVSEFAAGFFRDALKQKEGRAIGYEYFRSRGLEDATIEKFGLGWAPLSRHALADAARAAGYKEEFLVDTGLCVRRDDGSLSDRFYDRVIFPVHSPSGRPIAFGGRTLRTDKTVAKYVNSPETEIYVKSKSLYGIYFARNEMSRQDRCFLVEGYLDVISMHQLGITNVVASSGTSLTTDQVRLIKRFTENVTIIYDGDSAGIHAALRGIGLVLKEGMNVKVVLLPDGDDPDSYSRKHTLAEVQDFIASHEQDFIGFKSDILLGEAGDDPLKRANLINDVADTIALIPDAVKRSVYVDTCSAKFNIEPQLLFDRIGHTRGEMLSEEKRQMEYRKRREESSAADAGEAARLPDNAGQIPVLPVQAPEGLALEDRYLAPCERELLEFIVVSGDETLNFDRDSEFYSETEPPVPVAEFIDAALADDDVAFSNTIYRKTYDEYFSLYDKGLAQGQIRKRLLDNEDRDVAAVAKDILVDKYILTVENYRQSLTSESTRLVMNVPKSLLVYQLRRLDKMQKELEARLVDAGESPEEQMDIIREMDGINKARTIINKKIGRV